MAILLLAARVLLALVFLVAGLAKLADRPGSNQALRDFGLPTRLAAPAAVLLPCGEILVALALLPAASAWWGALAAFALLGVFVAGIAFNLARGRAPNCHCFGQLYSAPAGPRTLARNALLAAVALVIVWQGPANSGLSLGAAFLSLSLAAQVALLAGTAALAAIAVQGWFLVQLFRQHGRLLVRLDALQAQVANGRPVPPAAPRRAVGLAPGTPAPAFELPDLHGVKHSLETLRAAHQPLLLVFSDPGCGPCTSLLPNLAQWQQAYANRLSLALISHGTREANLARSTEHGVGSLLLEEGQAVADAYRVTVTPTGVLVNPDGTLGSLLAEGPDAIRELVAPVLGLPAPAHECNCGNSAGHRGAGHDGNGNHNSAPFGDRGADGNGYAQPERGLPIGTRAPDLVLPDLDGQTVDLAAFRGHATLLLFWNPQCSFCAGMLDTLKAWEREPRAGAPKLIVVSTGTVEANRAMGLRSPVVLRPDMALLQAFQVDGTPSAVLVDGKGRLASYVAVGADNVMALARSEAKSTRSPATNARSQATKKQARAMHARN